MTCRPAPGCAPAWSPATPSPRPTRSPCRTSPPGGKIIRYGVGLGYAKADIPAGSWISEHMLDLPESPSLKDMPYGTHIVPKEELPAPTRTTWMGYRNKVGPPPAPATCWAS